MTSHISMNRREFIQTTAGVIAATALETRGSIQREQRDSSSRVCIGVIGLGPRGMWLMQCLLNYPGVEITAVCDIKDDLAQKAVDIVTRVQGTAPAKYSGNEHVYRDLLGRDDVDGVMVATDPYATGQISFDTMRAGKHVGFEVPGVLAIEECHKMVRVKEQTGNRCMLLENCCYGNENMMVYNMIQQGVFGKPYYSVGSYLHNCRTLYFESDGSLTWRGRLVRDKVGCNYNSHGVGTASKWLGVNDGDRMQYCTAMMSKPVEMHKYAVERFGPGSPQAKVDFKNGDFVTTLVTTVKGRHIRIDNTITASRPYGRYYGLQATKGAYDSRRGLYLSGPDKPEEWKPSDQFMSQWQHPYWKRRSKAAVQQGGHGGIDWFVLYDFVNMIRHNREPWIDVYDASTWSSLLHCSRLSLERNGAAVEVPDFTGGRWRDPDWRKGRLEIA